MIRSSKHNIHKISNVNKLGQLDNLFIEYKKDLEIYVNYIIDGVLPLKKLISSKDLITENIKHSRYKQLIYKHSSEIIRSQVDRSKKRRYSKYKQVYSYFKQNGRQLNFVNKKFSELNIKDIIKTKYFTTPKIKELSINLDERFFNIKMGKSFDYFVNIKLPFFNEKGTRSIQINLPLKGHKHSNNLLKEGFSLKNNIQLKKINGEYYINLIWFKPDPTIKDSGDSIGIDLGYNKLMVTSNKQFLGGDMKDLYEKISRKKIGSKNFKKLLTHRDNLINFWVNKLDFNNVNKVIIEDLVNVKHKTKNKINNKLMNKLQRWSYIKTINKIERICEEKGVNVVKVSPHYTSQICSECGHVDKNSRIKENFICMSCGFEIDSDLNGSINIHNRGVYSPSNNQRKIFI